MMLRLFSSVLITAVFVIGAQYLVGWEKLLEPWRLIHNPASISIACGLLGITYATRAFRLCRYFRIESGFGACLRLQLYHVALVNLMPFRSGELAFPVLMRRYFDMPVSTSIGGLLWLRGFDLHVLLTVAVALLGMRFFGPFGALSATTLWIGLLLVVFVSLRKLLDSHAPGKLGRILHYARDASPQSPRQLVETWALTAANWGVKILVLAWILRLFVPQMHWYSTAAVTAGELAAVLPVQGFGGFGTYEAVVLATLSTSSVTTDAALAGAVNVHLFALGTSILAALAALLPLRSSYRAIGHATRRSGEYLMRGRARSSARVRRDLPVATRVTQPARLRPSAATPADR